MPQLIQGMALAFSSSRWCPLRFRTSAGPHRQRLGLSNFLRILAGVSALRFHHAVGSARRHAHSQLTEHISAYNPIANQSIDQLQQLGMAPSTAYATIERLITNQAYMLSTNDVFWLVGWIFLALIPLVWLAKPTPAPQGVVLAAE